jgi:hypothetical protein
MLERARTGTTRFIARQRRARCLSVSAALAFLTFALVFEEPARAVPAPRGAAKPTPGSGIGTKAALENPRCRTGERYGVYGRFDSAAVGGGPICVRPWKAGANNGGATSSGVTRERVKVFAITPDESQLALVSSGGAAPLYRADNSPSTYENAVHDHLLPIMRFYETWGRDLEVHFLKSSGSDETAQRADAIAIKAEKPFAVLNFVTKGLDVLDAELAKSKILVFGYATTTEKALAQAPYRWGQSDSQALAINTAEVIGKQLVGKKAKFAGSDDIKQQARRFGTVYMENVVEIAPFERDMKKAGAPLASVNTYPANGSTFGDPPTAAEQAPTIIARMKEAGVTTVVLFADFSMNKAMMEQATKLEWYPEWFFTGTVFHDIAVLSRQYPVEQVSHAFGISSLSPYVAPDPPPPPPQKSLSVLTNSQNWYWGEGVGTSASSVPPHLTWLLQGIHTAGPKLTPQTFQQGLFSMPAAGGAAQGYPTGMMAGYGRTAGLPYDEYMSVGLDFAAVWWDPDTRGPAQGTGVDGTGVAWYADGAKRYRGGTVPKKAIGWYDTATGVYKFDSRPTPAPEYAGDCSDCPSHGGDGKPGAGGAGFVAKAYGKGESALS